VLLHRTPLGEEEDWAWTPPSGARLPGEDIYACARRELEEEAGLVAEVRPVAVTGVDWALFVAAVEPGVRVVLQDVEHDRYAWVPVPEALRRCRPAVVADGIARALARIEARRGEGR